MLLSIYDMRVALAMLERRFRCEVGHNVELGAGGSISYVVDKWVEQLLKDLVD